ncbi:MAG: hypothetical protein Q7J35_10870 [Candidatus Methanoperedens sp.]|nr:hypothetical protein [Candidatus Methanoperedens sp.]
MPITIPAKVKNGTLLHEKLKLSDKDVIVTITEIPEKSIVEEISGSVHFQKEIIDELVENEDLYNPEDMS